jgi:hypothetical protein
MKHRGLTLLAALAGGCTIDAVARAELSGELNGDAIFQKAGTTDQLTYKLELDGADGTYEVHVADGACGAMTARFADAGVIDLVGGSGVMRGVTDEWDVASGGDNDIVGRSLVVEQVLVVKGCGEIFNSD